MQNVQSMGFLLRIHILVILHEQYAFQVQQSYLKRLYRQRVQEYHPDKIAAKGLPEEFTRFAQDKFREIQEAWEQIKAARGIK